MKRRNPGHRGEEDSNIHSIDVRGQRTGVDKLDGWPVASENNQCTRNVVLNDFSSQLHQDVELSRYVFEITPPPPAVVVDRRGTLRRLLLLLFFVGVRLEAIARLLELQRNVCLRLARFQFPIPSSIKKLGTSTAQHVQRTGRFRALSFLNA
jgi:hypothetical protein